MALRADARRLFFALWPDEPLRLLLYKETRHAVRVGGGKPVPPENFHITLVFLGQLDAKGAAAARAAAEATAGESFELVLDKFGFWPEAHVMWLGPSVLPERGSRFAAALRRALRARDIEVDIRPFMPHITLARKVTKPGDPGPIRSIHWVAREFVLVHSVAGNHASEYRVIGSWPLRAPPPEL